MIELSKTEFSICLYIYFAYQRYPDFRKNGFRSISDLAKHAIGKLNHDKTFSVTVKKLFDENILLHEQGIVLDEDKFDELMEERNKIDSSLYDIKRKIESRILTENPFIKSVSESRIKQNYNVKNEIFLTNYHLKVEVISQYIDESK